MNCGGMPNQLLMSLWQKRIIKRNNGRVAEWLKALLSKSSIPKRYREFESHLFRICQI